MAVSDEEFKAIIDHVDIGLGSTASGRLLGLSRNAIVGQRRRHGIVSGERVVVELAAKFPDATIVEIVEATGRDEADRFLPVCGVRGDYRTYRPSVVAKMRAALSKETRCDGVRES